MEKQSGYHQRSKAEAAMYRYKQLISPKLSLKIQWAGRWEMLAGVKVLNKSWTRNACPAATELKPGKSRRGNCCLVAELINNPIWILDRYDAFASCWYL